MADPALKVPSSVDGEFFVDTTCINCDACRQLAPGIFQESGEYSRVAAQPKGDSERRAAFHALLACPTGSIGTTPKQSAKSYMDDFPLPVDGEISYCGFNAESSFGGNSWFIRRPEGNWLIDSPRWVPHLVEKFHAMGGISRIFFTHRDDVADAGKYAAEFEAKRIIHRADLDAAPDAEIVVEGSDAVELEPGFVVIPTPGHTKGHCVLLYRDRVLFTGDHLEWDREAKRLYASRGTCWYSWSEQTESMARLTKFSFERILTGHGQSARLSPPEMRHELEALVGRMREKR